MKGSIVKFKVAVLLSATTCFFALAGCGGGSGSSEIPRNTVTEPTAQLTTQFKHTAIIAGRGRISNLTLSGTTLFWRIEDTIWKYTGGNVSPQLLVSGLFKTSNMVVHGNYAYWINTSDNKKLSIYRTSLDGSQTTLLYQGDAPFPKGYLSADDTALYFTTEDTSSFGKGTASVVIQKLPLDGSDPTALYHAANGIQGLIIDDNYIYVLDETGANAFAVNLVRFSKDGGSPQMLSQNINKINGGFTIANGSIYVGTFFSILKFPADGGAPTVLFAGDNTLDPYRLVVVQDTIYWTNNNENDYFYPYSIRSMPVGGGDITVVASNLSEPQNLLATKDGLYWSERQISGDKSARALKKLPWHTDQVTTVASDMYISSFDVSGGNAFLTLHQSLTGYSEVTKVSDAGVIYPLIGGLNYSGGTICATPDSLLVGDGSAIKKVPISGGVTTTLVKDLKFGIRSVKEKDGAVYFTSDGVKKGLFKVLATGGSPVVLAQEAGLYGTIVSVQDGYVYYVLSQDLGKITVELRRV